MSDTKTETKTKTAPVVEVVTTPTATTPAPAKKQELTPQQKYLKVVKSEQLAAQMAASISDADPEKVRRIVAYMGNAAQKNPLLYQSTRDSIMKVMLDQCSLGVEANGRDAYVLPYKNKHGEVEAQLMIDYKGYITLAYRSERVHNCYAELVYKNDKFTWKNGVIDHEIDWFGDDRGNLVGAYAVATLSNGKQLSAVMSKKEVDSIRARSRASTSGPWVTDYGEMAKKTVLRRLAKFLPLSPQAIAAIDYDMKQEFDDIKPTVPVSTAKPKQSADSLADALIATASDAIPEDADFEMKD